MTDTPDLREQIATVLAKTNGFENPGPFEHEQASRIVAKLPGYTRRLLDSCTLHRTAAEEAREALANAEAVASVIADQLREAEASRRDWAAEAESLDAAREKVVERLTEEIRWQKHVYRGEPRDSTDRAAMGRTIGMEDALRTVVDTFAEADQSRSVLSDRGGDQ